MMQNKRKILIAEDEKPLARALSLKLTNEGIETDVVHDGDLLREKIATHTYDLILMDLMMPKHDGFSVLEEMKATGNKTPVVIMSNLSQDSDRTRAAVAGALHYFVKSDIKLAEVVAFVKQTLNIK